MSNAHLDAFNAFTVFAQFFALAVRQSSYTHNIDNNFKPEDFVCSS